MFLFNRARIETSLKISFSIHQDTLLKDFSAEIPSCSWETLEKHHLDICRYITELYNALEAAFDRLGSESEDQRIMHAFRLRINLRGLLKGENIDLYFEHVSRYAAFAEKCGLPLTDEFLLALSYIKEHEDEASVFYPPFNKDMHEVILELDKLVAECKLDYLKRPGLR